MTKFNNKLSVKLLVKLSILLAGLLLVLLFRNYSSSGGLTSALSSFFGTTNTPKINWCAEHVVDVAWVSAEVPEKLKKLDMATLRNNYCELSAETISDIVIEQVAWLPLAESSGAAGAKSILEWNKELGLFRSAGLPFKSSAFSLELVDK